MTRRRRYLLIGLALTLGGLAALLFVAPLFLDQARYRALLTDQAGRLLNREVTADSLRVRLFPGPGVVVRGLNVENRAPWSGRLIEADRLDVTLKLLPLLKGAFQVEQIRIDRPKLRLVRDQNGSNYDDLIRAGARQPPLEQSRPDATKPARGQPVLPALLAGKLAIRDGTLIIDRSMYTGSPPLEIRNVNLDTALPPPLTPLRVHASGRLPGEASGSFELALSVRPDEVDHLPIEAHLTVRGAEVAELTSRLGLFDPSAELLRGDLDIEIKGTGNWPRIDLQADLNLQRVGLELLNGSGASGGKEAWLRARGQWNGDVLDLPEASLRWNDQTITGRLHLSSIKTPRIRFDVNVPRLDVESLVAMATAAGSGTAHPSATRPSQVTRRAPRLLKKGTSSARQTRGLYAEGRLRSPEVHWGRLILTHSEADLRYVGGILTIHRLRGSLYGGSLSVNAVLDRRGQLPHASITARLEDVQTEPLVGALQQREWMLRGVMTLDSNLEFAGQFGPNALTHASGQSDLVVTGGRLTGYPPLDRLGETLNPLMKGAGISSGLNEFNRLSAHWTLNRGVLRTTDLLLQREGARLLAAGSMNLEDHLLNFDVTAKVAKATLEAKVSGTPDDPVITPQVGRIEQRVKTELGKALKGKRGEALGKILKELFPR